MSEKFVTKSFKDYRKERLEKRVKECPMCSDLWHGYHDGFQDGQKEQQSKINTLTKQVKDYEKVLKFYADKMNWNMRYPNVFTEFEGSEKATQALEKYKEVGE